MESTEPKNEENNTQRAICGIMPAEGVSQMPDEDSDVKRRKEGAVSE
jgi:hypothetical protein